MAPPALQKYDAIIVDPDLDTRMRLKQATSAVHNFGKVAQLGTLHEVLQRLSGEDRCDVVFISYRFDHDSVGNFIKEAKSSKQGQDAAYVLVLKTKDQSASTVAQNVMIGADGFLFEPYSVDYLLEITNLAAKVKKERSAAREKGALKFLVNDIINQVDLVAYMKSAGYEVGPHLKKFKEMCTVFQTLSPESRAMYYEIAVNMFENAPLPTKIFQRKKYGGASDRVKKRMEKKIVAELETERGKLAEDPPKS